MGSRQLARSLAGSLGLSLGSFFSRQYADWLASATQGNGAVAAIALLWFSALASAIIDNIPYTATAIPVVERLSPALCQCKRLFLCLHHCLCFDDFVHHCLRLRRSVHLLRWRLAPRWRGWRGLRGWRGDLPGASGGSVGRARGRER